MFLLAELKDTIRIPPDTFHMKLIDAVKDEINRKLANKVNDNHPMSSHFCYPKEETNEKHISKLGFVKCWLVHCAKRHNPNW